MPFLYLKLGKIKINYVSGPTDIMAYKEVELFFYAIFFIQNVFFLSGLGCLLFNPPPLLVVGPLFKQLFFVRLPLHYPIKENIEDKYDCPTSLARGIRFIR